MSSARWLLLTAMVALGPALAQSRPDEAALFGESGPAEAVDGGTEAGSDAPTRAPEAPRLSSPSGPSGPSSADRDAAELGGTTIQSKFDTEELKNDALKVGGTLNLFAQSYWQEGRPFAKGTFGAPLLLDAYLDGRPNDWLRAFVLGRLQYDPTRPAGDTSQNAATGTQATPAPGSASLIGLTPQARSNPSVSLDQLWLRFDIARAVYLTVGRQKVRWASPASGTPPTSSTPSPVTPSTRSTFGSG